MAELQRRNFYQPQSVSQGFNPTRAADMTPSLRANQQRMLQEQQAFQNAAMADLQLQQKQEQYKLLAETKEAEQLMQFSKTLYDVVQGVAQDKIKGKEAEMRTLFFEDQQRVNEAKLLEQNVGAQLSELHDGDLAAADQSAVVNAPYEITQRLRNLNGWDKYYYGVLAAQSAGDRYSSWMENQLANNSETITVGNTEIQINNPQNSTEFAAVQAYLREQYNELPEVLSVGAPLLASHAADKWNKHDSKVAEEFQKQYAIDKSVEDRANAFNVYSATYTQNVKAFPQLFQTLRTTVDKKGDRLGNVGAWKEISNYFKDQADQGIDVTSELEIAKATPIPGDKKGRTYGDLYQKTQWGPLEEELGDEARTNFRNQQTDAKAQLHQYEQDVITELQEMGEVPNARLEEAIDGYNELAAKLQVYGEKPTALENFRGEATIEAKQLADKITQYEFLQERMMLDPNVILREGLEIQNKFLSIAQTQAKQRELTTKPGDKAVEGYIKGADRIKVSPDGSIKGMAALVIADAQASVNKRANEIYAVNPEAGFQAAYDQAFVEWSTVFDNGVNNPGSKYYINMSGKFDKFLPKVESVSNSLRRTDERIDTIEITYEALGTSALASPGLFGDEEFFQRLESGYGKPGWQMPPTIAHFAKKLNVSPFQIINEQRKALKMTELPEYRNLIFNEQQPPEYRRFINDLVQGKATQNKLNRYSGGPLPVRERFVSEVPQNNVLKFRRAIISQESGGSYTVVNPDSGAIGAGQVMPENVGPWTQKYLGRRLTPEEFRFNPAAQDIVINGRFNDMLSEQMKAGYNEETAVRRAAAEWYSGQPGLWNNTNPQYSNGRRYPSIAEYTSSIWKKYQSN